MDSEMEAAASGELSDTQLDEVAGGKAGRTPFRPPPVVFKKPVQIYKGKIVQAVHNGMTIKKKAK